MSKQSTWQGWWTTIGAIAGTIAFLCLALFFVLSVFPPKLDIGRRWIDPPFGPGNIVQLERGATVRKVDDEGRFMLIAPGKIDPDEIRSFHVLDDDAVNELIRRHASLIAPLFIGTLDGRLGFVCSLPSHFRVETKAVAGGYIIIPTVNTDESITLSLSQP